MNLQKVLVRFRGATDDGVELRRLARDVGYELATGGLDSLKEFRAGVAPQNSVGGTEFANGYRSALLDTVAAYELATEEKMKDEVAERLARGRFRPFFLELAKRPARPAELSRALACDPAQVSRILSEMREAALVAVWKVKADDGRSRLHRLTLRGQAIAAKLTGEVRAEQEHLQVADEQSLPSDHPIPIARSAPGTVARMLALVRPRRREQHSAAAG